MPFVLQGLWGMATEIPQSSKPPASLRKTDKTVGKNFHTAEPSFPRRDPTLGVPLRRGRENFKPSRWYPSEWLMRTVRARRVRAALGRPVAAASGALGISSNTGAAFGKDRRTATSAPPALTFNAVANSRNSLPLSSRLRTNTGIANGNRVHFRRSFSGPSRTKVLLLRLVIYTDWFAPDGPNVCTTL